MPAGAYRKYEFEKENVGVNKSRWRDVGDVDLSITLKKLRLSHRDYLGAYTR